MTKKQKEKMRFIAWYVVFGLVAVIAIGGVAVAANGILIQVENATMNFEGGVPEMGFGGDTNLDSLVLDNDLTVGDDLTVADDVAIAGDAAITGNLTFDGAISGEVAYRQNIVEITSTSSRTVTAAESGTTFVINATDGLTFTLPASTTEGAFYKFVIGTAPTATTTNYIIDSLDGDDIDGTLIVAGAVVDCRDEDQINFVNDNGLYAGDYVEVYCDGTQWYIGDSGVLTSAKLTCTDPS